MATPLDLETLFGRPCRAQPVALISGRCVLLGWSIREPTGAAAASVVIHNGADASGLEVASVQLNPAGTNTTWFGPQGVDTDVGIFPTVTGTVAGALYVWVPGLYD